MADIGRKLSAARMIAGTDRALQAPSFRYRVKIRCARTADAHRATHPDEEMR